MTTQLLDRHGARLRPMQRLVGDLCLARMRVHEVCGPARRIPVALLMAANQGPVVWIQPGWQPERPCPHGLRDFADPGRLILVRARRSQDLLWSMEEALRSGAVPLVVAELPGPPALTPVRRLHLAAEAGAETAIALGHEPPLGIMLTPEAGGAPGIETRWHCRALADGGWRLDRLRARMEPPAGWILRPGAAGVEIDGAAPD